MNRRGLNISYNLSRIDNSITKIQKVSRKIVRQVGSNIADEDRHIELLQTIYPIGLKLLQEESDIESVLAERLGRDGSDEFFSLLIESALPTVPRKVRKNWAGALAYAQEANIRPEKLQGFIFIKGGLSKCGSATREERTREIDRWREDCRRRKFSDARDDRPGWHRVTPDRNSNG